MSDKLVIEDWSRYNAAVQARARHADWRRWWPLALGLALLAIAAAYGWWELQHRRLPAAAQPSQQVAMPAAPLHPAAPVQPNSAQPPPAPPLSPSQPPSAQPLPRAALPRATLGLPDAVQAPQPQRTPGGDRVVTNFTLFQTVGYKGGDVVTGWNFATSNDQAPYEQYCYFSMREEGKEARVEVEHRPGSRFKLPDLLAGQWTLADWDEAATKCVWFNGPMAPAPEPPATTAAPDQPSVAGPKESRPVAPTPASPPESGTPPAPDAPQVTPDQLAELLRALKEGGLPAIPGADPAAVAATVQGLRDRAKWETFFNSLPEGDARAGALFWASERSMRNPRNCDAQSASSAFVAACEQARAMLAPYDERRKTEPAYRHGWNSYKSAEVSATGPTEAVAFRANEATARSFVVELAQALSSDNQRMDAFYANAYAPTVDFYGTPRPADYVVAAKHDYGRRWPIRSYTVRQASLAVVCESDRCKVSGLADWDYSSPERNTRSAGVASFALVLTIQEGTAKITSESGSVVERVPI